jgi:hypothetical protein
MIEESVLTGMVFLIAESHLLPREKLLELSSNVLTLNDIAFVAGKERLLSVELRKKSGGWRAANCFRLQFAGSQAPSEQ